MERERIITIAIMAGLFGGLVRWTYCKSEIINAPPQKRFMLFIIPEFIGFAFLGLMVYYGKSRKKGIKDDSRDLPDISLFHDTIMDMKFFVIKSKGL